MSKTKKASYDDIISALTEALSVREKDLDAREEQLENDRQDFEKIRFTDYSNTSPSDVLDLNVGGVKTSVLRRTLTSIPDSVLATRFSGRWDDSIEKDKDGCFFIDQDEYLMFRHITKFMRQKAIGDGTRYSAPDLRLRPSTISTTRRKINASKFLLLV